MLNKETAESIAKIKGEPLAPVYVKNLCSTLVGYDQQLDIANDIILKMSKANNIESVTKVLKKANSYIGIFEIENKEIGFEIN